MSLPQALQPLGTRDQFILWQWVWDKKTEEYKKVPVNQHRKWISAHDPAHWLPYAQAVRYAHTGKLGVAFVLTDNDPFFCIDVDKCINEMLQLSDTALDLIAMLPGVAVEVSVSKTGLHLWGQYSKPLPPHRTVLKPIEFYVGKRFIALTSDIRQGDMSRDYADHLPNVIHKYLKPDTLNALDAVEWTFTPRHDWRGPTSDKVLIETALKSGSLKALFGEKASFKDLWTANVEVLGKVFPPIKNSAFDHHRADQALCAHLAFYTGCNCERIDKLFRESALNRDKWRNREQYRRDTILRAISNTRNVYSKDYKKEVKSTVKEICKSNQTGERQGDTFLDSEDQKLFFKGCVYIESHHRIYCPDGLILKPDAFNVRYGGRIFKLDTLGKKLTWRAFEAFTQNQVLRFPTANGLAFRPERPPGQIFERENLKLLNTYVPLNREFKKGDVSKFLDLIKRLLPNETDGVILLSYLAALVQYPGRKFRWCTVLQGVKGNGKSIVGTLVEYAVGYRYTHRPDDKGLANNFNFWMSGNTLAIVEDVSLKHRYDLLNRLKSMITCERGAVEPKGVDQATVDVCFNIFMTVNEKDDVPVDDDERRYGVFYTAQQSKADLDRDGLTEQYFKDLGDWIKSEGYEAVAHFLANYPIPEIYNPATHALRAPMTSTMAEAFTYSRCRFQEEVLIAIEEERPGFRKGWISSIALRQLTTEIRSRMSSKHYTKKLRQIDYIKCPELPQGKASHKLVSGIDAGKRPVLYCEVSKIDEIKRSKTEPTVLYEESQV